MSQKDRTRIKQIGKELLKLSQASGQNLNIDQHRKYYGLLRELLHRYENIVFEANKNGIDLEDKALRKSAADALLQLGGTADPCNISLKHYDHIKYGPFLGVSDEGSAGGAIRHAALNSPKMKAIGTAPPIIVGVALDAERLAAVGEVAVGPEEYRVIRLECLGSILTSTNVGTRLNLRYYKSRPIIYVKSGQIGKVIKAAVKDIQKIVEPFWHTPDGKSRPLTVLISFKPRTKFDRRLAILKELQKVMQQGEICDPTYHSLGLLTYLKRGKEGLSFAKRSIDLAKKAGVSEVAIKGNVLAEADDKISMPGILNYFSPCHASELLQYASKKNIIITPKNLVDPDTVARNVWSGLSAARHMGLELGKYGLFPLTLEESAEIMSLIQKWFADWTAAPVLYFDFPLVCRDKVYDADAMVEGAKRWLDMVAKHKIPMVLFDTADKDKGLRILKDNEKDKKGILSIEQVKELDRYAGKKSIRVLWAGGITLPQVLEFGKLGVFGIYVTSSACAQIPVTASYGRDPMLPSVKEPTFAGVSKVKLLLEVGFLVNRMKKNRLNNDARRLEEKAEKFLELYNIVSKQNQLIEIEKKLSSLTEKAWKVHY